MKPKLLLPLGLIFILSPVYAVPSYYCGLMPLPENSRLRFVVYDVTDDPNVNAQVSSAYRSILKKESVFFQRYNPRIVFAETPSNLADHAFVTSEMATHTVVVILGVDESLASVQPGKNLTITLVPNRNAIDKEHLVSLEQQSREPYYSIAAEHALLRGTRMLVEDPTSISTISVDHILSGFGAEN